MMFTSYYQSPVGTLRLMVTGSCISAVHFCTEEELAMNPVSYDFFHPLLQQCTEQLIEYFQGQRRIFDIPVHQNGTDFQQRVWSQLTEIPFGKTCSYKDIARKLGDPLVIRAAAAANGKNSIAIIVPCHRVIGSNRELVGYAGGLWRKQWLLAHENRIAHGVQTLF